MIGKLLLSAACVLAPCAVHAATVSLDFDTLPSAQGWTYRAYGTDAGYSEAAAFELSNGALVQHTAGFYMGGGGSNYYGYDLDLTGQDNLTLNITAAVDYYEAIVSQQGAAYPYGFAFGFVAGGFDYYVGIASNRFGFVAPGGATTYGDWAPGFTISDFNTYTLTGHGGLLSFAANGVTLVTDGVVSESGATDVLYLGDGTAGANANARVSAFSFTTGGVPEPASWAMMLAGFALAGGALRRTRAAVAA